MNKSKLKKKIDSDNLKNLREKSKFIGFFCTQNINVTEKIQLKKELKKQGFNFTLVKTNTIFNTFFKSLPHMKGLLSGSLAICYNEENKGSFNFSKLKEIFLIIKKQKNIFFLGGFFENSCINSLFELKISKLKDIKSLQLEQMFLIQNILEKVVKTTSISKNELSILLSNKK
jgi:ribosomal protein L10